MLDQLEFAVCSRATGAVVAAFMLRDDAQDYANTLYEREGPHGPGYDVLRRGAYLLSYHCGS